MKNEMTLAFDSLSENEGFARVAVAAFVTQLNPTLEEVADIKTAVSEAVTNAIIHGYPNEVHTVVVRARLQEETVELWVVDNGVGIEDVKKAMEAFMDQVKVESEPSKGTTVYMRKKIQKGVTEQEA